MASTRSMTARDIMSPGVQCVGEHESLLDAARMMRDQRVGCVPICGDDNGLKGMITDRDIVVGCVAEGRDPAATEAGTLAGQLHWIGAEAGAEEALRMMEEHRIKRLPVIDVENGHQLCGMIAEADLARNLTDAHLAEFATKVYAAAG